jgi:uncharacterized protein (DUF885 family)
VNDTTALKDIAERVWRRRLEREPYLRLKVGEPITWIPAGNREEAREDASFARQVGTELEEIEPETLPHEDWLTLGFLRFQSARLAQSEEQWLTDFPVTPYTGYWMSLYAQEIFAPFRFEEQEDLDRYVKLLEDYAAAVRTSTERLEAQAERGWRIPRPALPGTRAALQGIKAGAPSFFGVDPERVSHLDLLAPTAFVERVEDVLRQRVEPAFDAVVAYLDEDYEARAPETVGIGQFDGGEEAYRRFLHFHVTEERDPEEVHTVGLEEVERLTEAMQDVRDSLGFSEDEEAFHDQMRVTGRIYADSPEEVEETYRYHIRRLEPFLDQYFAVLPEAPYDVKRLDPSLEAGMTYGYYEPPTGDREVGLYRYNGSGLDTRSQLSAATLIYHELVPGHHFHIARQAENEDLPPLRREAMGLGGYNEGWAEYAAELPKEMGLYDDPYDLYGRLVHERFTAQRLVVDTGMNLFGWSLERGRAFMRANTMESETQVGTETLRYSTDMPAQALAYRLGFLKMRALRERAEEALGSAFDIKAFHEAILGPGALPLSVLEKQIDAFVEESTP